jgi:hypothetical protein
VKIVQIIGKYQWQGLYQTKEPMARMEETRAGGEGLACCLLERRKMQLS